MGSEFANKPSAPRKTASNPKTMGKSLAQPHQKVRIQQEIGNRGVSRLIESGQSRLSKPGDRQEQEAERVKEDQAPTSSPPSLRSRYVRWALASNPLQSQDEILGSLRRFDLGEVRGEPDEADLLQSRADHLHEHVHMLSHLSEVAQGDPEAARLVQMAARLASFELQALQADNKKWLAGGGISEWALGGGVGPIATGFVDRTYAPDTVDSPVTNRWFFLVIGAVETIASKGRRGGKRGGSQRRSGKSDKARGRKKFDKKVPGQQFDEAYNAQRQVRKQGRKNAKKSDDWESDERLPRDEFIRDISKSERGQNPRRPNDWLDDD